MPAGDMTRTEQVDDDFIPADARPVCMKCLQPCHPLQYYCDKCDSNDVINPLASYMPIERIRLNCGIFLTMWQRVFHDRDTSAATRLSYLYMLTMFVPIILVVGLPLFLIFRMPRLVRKTTIIALCIAAIVLLIFFYFGRLFTGLPTYPIAR